MFFRVFGKEREVAIEYESPKLELFLVLVNFTLNLTLFQKNQFLNPDISVMHRPIQKDTYV